VSVELGRCEGDKDYMKGSGLHGRKWATWKKVQKTTEKIVI
jgi:hypothetical protein